MKITFTLFLTAFLMLNQGVFAQNGKLSEGKESLKEKSTSTRGQLSVNSIVSNK